MNTNYEETTNNETTVNEIEEKEKKPVEKKLWHNGLFLGIAIFLMAPLGLVWMWIDKGFDYKKTTKLIVTIFVLIAGVATMFLRNAAIEKYPELKGQPNTVIIQKVLEK